MKGIDPKARETAKDLARRSGMTLGEWLNQVILEDTAPGEAAFGAYDEPPAPTSPEPYQPAATYHDRRFDPPAALAEDLNRVADALERLSERIEAAEHRSTDAIRGVDQSVHGLLSRMEAGERDQVAVAARFEGAIEETRGEQARIDERLRRMEQDQTGPRSLEALRALEGALGKVANHLYEGEARTREALGELRQSLGGVVMRVERMSSAPPPNPAAVVDAVMARINGRLEQAESRTSQAMKGLETSFAQLDRRLNIAETRIADDDQSPLEMRLEQLATALSDRLEGVRAEMAEQLKAAADGRFERMERTLEDMTKHVQAAEQRSASAIERMGHEVLRMADTLTSRVQGVETRAADAIEHVGGEVSRIADAMEARMARADDVQAQALEKLGGEIARITEKLSERIANAERRNAQAIDDVGEQVARVTERINTRHERSTGELADRIRQSEERTAKLLEEAREKIDQRLSEAHKKLSEQVAAGPAMASPFADPGVAPFGHDSFSAQPFTPQPEPTPAYTAPVYTPPSTYAARATTARTYDTDPVAPLAFSPIEDEPEAASAPDDDFSDLPDFEPQAFEPLPEPEPAAVAPPAFTAPAFIAPTPEPEPAAAEAVEPEFAALDEFVPLPEPHETEPPAFQPDPEWRPDALAAPAEAVRSPSTRDLIENARAAARAASQANDIKGARAAAAKPKGGEGLFSGLGFGGNKKKRRAGSTLRSALFMSGTAAALGVAAAGYMLLAGRPVGTAPERVARNEAGHSSPATPLGEPQAAVALTTGPLTAGKGATDQQQVADAAATLAPAAQGGPELYADAVRHIESGDKAGVDTLRKSANLGYGPAQFYLAMLYDTGAAGLKKDQAEARRWTERAAQGGDRKAMHNLGLDYFNGIGGARNPTLAATWFRKAADLGLVDSQYNLGRLYENGLGVSQNPAEAYKWYLIASRSGDGESLSSAQRLRKQLSVSAQAAADRAAQAYRPQTAPAPMASARAPGGDVAQAQRALSRLGYYQGPTDGSVSPALRLAVTAYQRDQGLPATGELDPTVMGKLGG